MTFFETELIKMFGKNTTLSDIRCVGNTLMGRLTSDTIAKISIITTGYADHYTSTLIQVINSHEGEVDRLGINFSEAFGYSRKKGIYIWNDNGDCSWYNFKPSPKNYEAINHAAQQYLEMFCEPVQGMGMNMSM